MDRTRELITFRLLTLASQRRTVGEISAPIFEPIAVTYFVFNNERYLGILFFDPINWAYGTYCINSSGDVLKPFTLIKKDPGEVKIEEISLYALGDDENLLSLIVLEPAKPGEYGDTDRIFVQANQTARGLSHQDVFWDRIDLDYLQSITGILGIITPSA